MEDRSEHDPAPFAAGVHLPWSDAPDRVRDWVEASVGSAVVAARDMTGGFSPGCCALLRFEDGRSAFVKAVGATLNPDSPAMHRKKAQVAAALPPSAQFPRLMDRYDEATGWRSCTKRSPARCLATRGSEAEFERVLEGVACLHEALTPCPIPEIEPTSVQFAWALDGWRSLAAMSTPPPGLDGWTRRNLDRLAEMEADGLAAADAGDTLVHGDIRSDNVLLGHSSVVFIDWPHASRGAPAFDLVAWAPSVALEGGPDPESLLGRYRLGSAVEPEATTALIAAIAGFFTFHATLGELPGLPTLRSLQGAQGSVARAWLRQRTGWA